MAVFEHVMRRVAIAECAWTPPHTVISGAEIRLPSLRSVGMARWVGNSVHCPWRIEDRISPGRPALRKMKSVAAAVPAIHPSVEVLDVDDVAARIYAEIMVALRKAGTPLPTNDIWVAAVAVRDGAAVLTYDLNIFG